MGSEMCIRDRWWIGEDIVGFSGTWNSRSAGVGVGIGMGIWTGAGQNRRCVICVIWCIWCICSDVKRR